MYWDLHHITLFYTLGYDKMAAHLVELERAAGTSDLMLSRYTYPKDMSQAERAAEVKYAPSDYFELTGPMLSEFEAIEGTNLLSSTPVIQALMERGFSHANAVSLLFENEPPHHFWTPDYSAIQSAKTFTERFQEENSAFTQGPTHEFLYDPRDIAAWLETVAPQQQS